MPSERLMQLARPPSPSEPVKLLSRPSPQPHAPAPSALSAPVPSRDVSRASPTSPSASSSGTAPSSQPSGSGTAARTMRIMKRAPGAGNGRDASSRQSARPAPTIGEREKAYKEARERIFGPAASSSAPESVSVSRTDSPASAAHDELTPDPSSKEAAPPSVTNNDRQSSTYSDGDARPMNNSTPSLRSTAPAFAPASVTAWSAQTTSFLPGMPAGGMTAQPGGSVSMSQKSSQDAFNPFPPSRGSASTAGSSAGGEESSDRDTQASTVDGVDARDLGRWDYVPGGKGEYVVRPRSEQAGPGTPPSSGSPTARFNTSSKTPGPHHGERPESNHAARAPFAPGSARVIQPNQQAQIPDQSSAFYQYPQYAGYGADPHSFFQMQYGSQQLQPMYYGQQGQQVMYPQANYGYMQSGLQQWHQPVAQSSPDQSGGSSYPPFTAQNQAHYPAQHFQNASPLPTARPAVAQGDDVAVAVPSDGAAQPSRLDKTGVSRGRVRGLGERALYDPAAGMVTRTASDGRPSMTPSASASSSSSLASSRSSSGPAGLGRKIGNATHLHHSLPPKPDWISGTTPSHSIAVPEPTPPEKSTSPKIESQQTLEASISQFKDLSLGGEFDGNSDAAPLARTREATVTQGLALSPSKSREAEFPALPFNGTAASALPKSSTWAAKSSAHKAFPQGAEKANDGAERQENAANI
ncbi:hypothetical protein IE81DRAFT_36667 [Ceraceosorus guamensis]|uniref:SUZ domain-containing protein n=1 Tax=Ceraceosorus guamensis TaxID=1522189 RepID=A0A316W602_9BASI|nr:hypothetical protein IE81DRAFT_36667 [Ceraceosorus guamensis]PWN44161.1 hypothetical protein IE81DRAFT_36667 [Ceraceosorus guamensis]